MQFGNTIYLKFHNPDIHKSLHDFLRCESLVFENGKLELKEVSEPEEKKVESGERIK